MGNSSSFTSKVDFRESLLSFTKWNEDDLARLYLRATSKYSNGMVTKSHTRSYRINLSDSYSLRRDQFEYLVDAETIGVLIARDMYDHIFSKSFPNHDVLEEKHQGLQQEEQQNPMIPPIDSNLGMSRSNGKANKFEVICVIVLLSNTKDEKKIEFLFDLFDFNEKGYLFKEELTLLFLSITFGCYKIDSKLLTPSHSLCEKLTDYMMKYYSSTVLSKKDGIRRRDLIRFIHDTSNIKGFLESFHGHCCQILLPISSTSSSNNIAATATTYGWRDPLFPASYESIYPTIDFGNALAMPPVEFISWIRFGNRIPTLHGMSGEESQSSRMFTHQMKFLKTIDHIQVYDGDGILGDGKIRKFSLLANKWIQNAILLVIASKPLLFSKLFPVTKQEDYGRYCFQLFEGLSWRLIYCDNRIPCGGINHQQPLFLTSSDPHEMCLLILEKALAKYLGSYSHIASCSSRVNAVDTAIRFFTGGHVIRDYIRTFTWSSYFVHNTETSGVDYVSRALNQGSIIGFIRSERNISNATTLSQNPNDRFPCGYIYPLIHIITVKDKKYLLFKDSWGIPGIPYSSLYASTDSKYGHKNTFRILVEDITKYFDMMIMSRYPDLEKSYGSQEKGFSENKNGKNKNTWYNQCMEHISSGPNQPAVFKLTIGNVNNDNNNNNNNNGENENENDDKNHSETNNECQSNPVDVSFTLSSNVPWVVSGDRQHAATTRVVIIPSYETRIHLESMRTKNSTKTTPTHTNLVSKTNTTTTSRIEENDGSSHGDCWNSYETTLLTHTSWASFHTLLYPGGTYYLFADISFNKSYSTLRQMIQPHDNVMNNYPWISNTSELTSDQPLILQVSSMEEFSVSIAKQHEIPDNNVDLILLNENDVKNDGKDNLPIVTESQSEAASHGLINILSTLQQQQHLIEIEFEEHKKDLQSMIILHENLSKERNLYSVKSSKNLHRSPSKSSMKRINSSHSQSGMQRVNSSNISTDQ